MPMSQPVGVAPTRWLGSSRRSRRGRATEPRASGAAGGATAPPRARPRVVQRRDTLEDDASDDVFATLSAPPEWASKSTNPPLMGNFAPVVGECEIGDLDVEGSIPESVRGVYLRNGPNPAREPLLGAGRYHWFDGDGMLHWIKLGGGGDEETERKTSSSHHDDFDDFDDEHDDARSEQPVSSSYGRAYVRTKNFEREAAKGASLYTGLRDITPVWRVLLPRLFTKIVEDWRAPDSPFWVVQSKNTANNGVKAHAGALLATYESGAAYEVELNKSLKTRGVCDFRGSFGTADYWLDNMTAHAKTCPATGELVYMGYNLISIPDGPFKPFSATAAKGGDGKKDAKTTDVVIGAVDARGERTSRRVIKMSRPSMQHDVGITRTKVVLLDGPLVFDLDRVLTGGLPFAFETDQTMRLGFLPRASEADGEASSDVTWVDTGEPCFAYHVVNCYDDPEDADVVVVDVCKSDGTNALGMARGFDDDADGQGWRPANGGKNGYVGDDAMGVRDDENAFEAFVNDAFRGLGAVIGTVRSKARLTQSPYDANANEKAKTKTKVKNAVDPRDAERRRAPALGSHENAVGHGRDVAALWRWRVNLRTKTLVSSRRLCAEPSDFPCVDPRDVGAPYAFCYTAGYAAATLPKRRMDVPCFDKVHKHDVAAGTHHTYFLDAGRACGDIAFVPKTTGDGKGGHLLVLTHDVAGDAAFASGVTNRGTRGTRGTRANRREEGKNTRNANRAPTELLILADDRDDRNPDLRLVGKVKIPVRVPFGFHNEFVAEAELPPGAW